MDNYVYYFYKLNGILVATSFFSFSLYNYSRVMEPSDSYLDIEFHSVPQMS